MRPALLLMSSLVLALLSACATTRTTDPRPAATSAPVSAFDKAREFDGVVVSGQPTRDDLASLRDRGITRVINLRGDGEMKPETLGFDEAAALAALGIAYSRHPIDKPEAYTPELLAAFAEQMAADEGKILLHCATGVRAGNLYAAYAMKHLGQTPDEAARLLEAVGGWPLPLERLTGERLALVRRDDLTKLGFED